MSSIKTWPIHSPLSLNPLIATLKPQSNGPSYSNTVIGTLAVDVWAVTFGTARRVFGVFWAFGGFGVFGFFGECLGLLGVFGGYG